MTNTYRSVFYIGVTSDLVTRVYQHQQLMGSNFTKKYKCLELLYFEFFDSIEEAIQREKQLKKWKREWKEELIKKQNPEMKDLSNSIDRYR